MVAWLFPPFRAHAGHGPCVGITQAPELLTVLCAWLPVVAHGGHGPLAGTMQLCADTIGGAVAYRMNTTSKPIKLMKDRAENDNLIRKLQNSIGRECHTIHSIASKFLRNVFGRFHQHHRLIRNIQLLLLLIIDHLFKRRNCHLDHRLIRRARCEPLQCQVWNG